jgi:Na+/melibiose symporter-like transporter
MSARNDQRGFITMIVILLAILIAAIVFAYLRVKSHQQG